MQNYLILRKVCTRRKQQKKSNLQIINRDVTSSLVIPFSILNQAIYFNTLWSRITHVKTVKSIIFIGARINDKLNLICKCVGWQWMWRKERNTLEPPPLFSTYKEEGCRKINGLLKLNTFAHIPAIDFTIITKFTSWLRCKIGDWVK